ncbi:MAG: regulatory protein FmdB family [Gemmatimonadetes bacterium]|jgi:putative FmdB family regulatory protein|nr:regulatory protein FmdB family [Gemmatimonadota bacterium]
MPTYEFRCPQGHEFEKFYRTISGAEAQAACPACGQISERMLSAAGFAFKGSGFYLTDYGKNAHREKGTPAPASPSSGDGAKAEGSKAEGGKSESAKSEGGSGGTSAPAGESSKPAAEPKPATPAPKKGTSE